MNLSTTRRKFLTAGGAAMVGAALGRGDTPPAGSPEASVARVRELARATLAGAGYDESAGDGAVMCVIGDPHICLGDEYPTLRTEQWDDGLIAEINGMAPLATDICVAGDLICYHSMTPGIPRHPTSLAWARDEFVLARAELQRFSKQLRLWAVPGNHDTDAFETDAELWREMLGIPPYRKAVLGGVPVFFLNSGNGGMLDAAQLAWFKSEAARIPGDQEVVVVMHHPVFFAMRELGAMKRVLCEMFGGRAGTVWIASGHDHLFYEQTYTHKGTRFVQMEVTAANPKIFSDKRSPGYILLAMQGGRVVSRLFRSLKDEGFQVTGLVARAGPAAVKFQFDEIPLRADTFEEGLYDRTGRVVSFSGVDVGSYIVYCKDLTLRVRPRSYKGKLTELVLAGTIGASLKPTCTISRTGAAGSWETLPFPANRGAGLFRIPLPVAYRDAFTYLVRIDAGVTAGLAGFNLSGWALVADGAVLTGFQRWLQARFGHLRKEAATAPLAITPGTTQTNLVNFAFNLLPGTAGGIAPAITGLPRFSRVRRPVLDFRFARRPVAADPGLAYTVEWSLDLRDWQPVEPESWRLRTLSPAWEEVTVLRPIEAGPRKYFRVGVAQAETGLGGFGSWRKAVAMPGGREGDVDGDGLNDLLEFAFDLDGANGGTRRYDAGRTGRPAGMPVQTVRKADVSCLVFPRMKVSANPGAVYALECSVDLVHWVPVPAWQCAERVLRSDGEWDEVEVTILDEGVPMRSYRVSVTEPGS